MVKGQIQFYRWTDRLFVVHCNALCICKLNSSQDLVIGLVSLGSIIIWKPSSNNKIMNTFKKHKIVDQAKIELIHLYAKNLVVVVKGRFQIYQIDQLNELNFVTSIYSGMENIIASTYIHIRLIHYSFYCTYQPRHFICVSQVCEKWVDIKERSVRAT